MRVLVGALSALLLVFATQDARAQTPSIENYAAGADMRSVSMSPSGRYIAFIRDDGTRDLLVVIDMESNRGRPIQSVEERVGELLWVAWKNDQRLLFGIRQEGQVEGRNTTGSRTRGSEDFEFAIHRVMAVNSDGTNGVQMFNDQTSLLAGGFGSTLLVDALVNDPEKVLLTAQDNQGVGVWRANINTGRAERVIDGAWETYEYVTDVGGNPVVRVDALNDGSGYRILRRAPNERRWTTYRDFRRTALATNSPDFQVIGAGANPGEVYVLARPETQDLLGVYTFNASTGEMSAPLAEGAQADIDQIWVEPATNRLIATCEYGQRRRCTSNDPPTTRQLRALQSFLGEDATMWLADISTDGNIWLIAATGPSEPGAYYVFDRTAMSAEAVGEVYSSAPRDEQNAPVQLVSYQSRDGTPLWAYVTARAGSGPRPMVVFPHGGPEARDYHGYDAYAQFLASRGYVVVQPNFRGSGGFGRNFADAGRGQWGARMQDDVTDAVQHMITTGVADPQRICIVGASYGGYAALAGVTLTPDLYRCAISIAGVSDLIDILRTERLENGRTSPSYHYWLRSIGNPGENREAITAASPARLADRVRAPVLLIHGGDDNIVLYSQSETMQRALERAGKPTRLVRLEDEGHTWAQWSAESRATLFRETEAFLAQHLGAN